MSRTRHRPHYAPPKPRPKGNKTRSRIKLEVATTLHARPRCEKTGKVVYERHREAAAALDLQRRINVKDGPGSMYRCQQCGHWHLSKWPPGAYKRARYGQEDPR